MNTPNRSTQLSSAPPFAPKTFAPRTPSSSMAMARVLCLSLISLAFLSQLAAADDASELKQNVKWSIFHEGCRVFADDNRIGSIGGIRECLFDTQLHNGRAQNLLANANDETLRSVVQQACDEIPGEFNLVENFTWVMYHEGQAEHMRQLLESGNYEEIRRVYENKQNHNPNVRNLLAAVSNRGIAELINNH